jgi:Domain of unknown function (DUF6487)
MRNSIDCPHCKKAMAMGYVAERGHGSVLHELEWSEGPPVRSWWFGMLKKAEVVRTLRAYRCDGCGMVQFYAY